MDAWRDWLRDNEKKGNTMNMFKEIGRLMRLKKVIETEAPKAIPAFAGGPEISHEWGRNRSRDHRQMLAIHRRKATNRRRNKAARIARRVQRVMA